MSPSTRVYNKRRVSNALYVPCKMFSESHSQGIKKLTNENTQFKNLLWAWPRVQANDSTTSENAIQNKRSSRIYHKND